MTTERSLIATDIDFERDGFQTGSLRLPYSHDRSAYGHIPIPISMLAGGTGPTLLLIGGSHGDEYEGPVALMKLVRRMPSMRISGRLIVVPGLNFPALRQGARTSPIDAGNLNRAYPGSRAGSVTAMIAHYVDTELLPRADVVFDIHAGGASFGHWPTLLIAMPRESARHDEYRRLVRSFGAPRAMFADLLGEDRTLAAAADRHAALFLCGEFGGYATCSASNLQLVEQGIERLMRAMGLVDGGDACPAPAEPQLLAVRGSSHYVFAPRAGLFEPTFAIGDAVRCGQPAGRIHDLHEPLRPPLELRFGSDGFVMCLRSFAGVEPGDCLAHLAEATDWTQHCAIAA